MRTIPQGTFYWRASSQADFIQNYFLWKRMFRKQNFRKKRYFWYNNTLLLSLFGPMQKHHVLPLWVIFSSVFLSRSPLPAIVDARMDTTINVTLFLCSVCCVLLFVFSSICFSESLLFLKRRSPEGKNAFFETLPELSLPSLRATCATFFLTSKFKMWKSV